LKLFSEEQNTEWCSSSEERKLG